MLVGEPTAGEDPLDKKMNNNTPAGAPIQHLGAASREPNEPESIDGDFASSGEAEAAERAVADFDTELTDQELSDIFAADTAARERENMVGTMGGYFAEGAERDFQEPGDEPGGAIFAQARVQEAGLRRRARCE